MKYLAVFSKLFNSRVFLMLGMVFLFTAVALENAMRVMSRVHLDATRTEIFFTVVPPSILLLLISTFLVVTKRRWADFPAIALLFLGLILHRPFFWSEYLNPDWHLFSSIAEVPFNYLFYPACVALIVFLIFQIKNKKYKIKLK